MKFLKIALIAVFGFTATACEDGNQTAGTVIGAGVGALVGNQFGSGAGRVAATVAGAAIGAYIGNRIGKELDRRDREIAQANANNTLNQGQTGTTSNWNNPDTGNHGSVTPTSGAYRNKENRLCRDFKEDVVLKNGKKETITGTRCQKADGSWEFVG